MADTLTHRGPDGDGYWINESTTAGFGHRRLAIIDLTKAGAQPMHYLERYTIVYNGEIYNYLELRKGLERAGYSFRSQSDTEVILAAYDLNKTDCLKSFDGMFSFAIWDEQEKELFAARDRFGEKPFYFNHTDKTFSFASEMKALWVLGIAKSINPKMLLDYLTLGYVQNAANRSATFYENIFSLIPSHYLLYNLKKDKLSITRYWDIDKQASEKYTHSQALLTLDNLLHTSVSRRLRSDVPTGTSLSGGLDSSTILYYIKKIQQGDVSFKTFSAVFPGFEKDESEYIRLMTDSTQTLNHQIIPTADSLINDFEKLAYHQEEPFTSSSIYAQFKVFELAKSNNIKVLLDGQGADELLGGYHKYIHWYLQELVSRYRFSKFKNEKKLLAANNVNTHWDFKNILAVLLPSHAALALEKREYKKIRQNNYVSASLKSAIKDGQSNSIYKPVVTKLNDMLYFNTMCHGLEELLRYADRNSMAHGVEVRLPFLNAQLAEFIFSLPSDLKIQNGYPKWILRKLMDHKLPAGIVWRKDKIGYEPPQKLWMQDDKLKDYMHEAKKKLVNNDILDPVVLEKKPTPRHAHDADNFDWRYLCAAQLLKK